MSQPDELCEHAWKHEEGDTYRCTVDGCGERGTMPVNAREIEMALRREYSTGRPTVVTTATLVTEAADTIAEQAARIERLEAQQAAALETIERLTTERDEAVRLMGLHDPTGTDHVIELARVIEENDKLRGRIAELDAELARPKPPVMPNMAVAHEMTARRVSGKPMFGARPTRRALTEDTP